MLPRSRQPDSVANLPRLRRQELPEELYSAGSSPKPSEIARRRRKSQMRNLQREFYDVRFAYFAYDGTWKTNETVKISNTVHIFNTRQK
jgi:hypothetical protein